LTASIEFQTACIFCALTNSFGYYLFMFATCSLVLANLDLKPVAPAWVEGRATYRGSGWVGSTAHEDAARRQLSSRLVACGGGGGDRKRSRTVAQSGHGERKEK
jgi:hypothetical protein